MNRLALVSTAVLALAVSVAGTCGYAAGSSREPANGPTPDGWVERSAHAGHFSLNMDAEEVFWRDRPQRTDRRDWSMLTLGRSDQDALGRLVDTVNPLTVTLSGVIAGGPVEVRVVDKGSRVGSRVLSPGAVRLGPGASAFTFVGASLRSPGCDRRFYLEWRSPTGARAEISKMTTIIRFKQAPQQPGACA